MWSEFLNDPGGDQDIESDEKSVLAPNVLDPWRWHQSKNYSIQKGQKYLFMRGSKDLFVK